MRYCFALSGWSSINRISILDLKYYNGLLLRFRPSYVDRLNETLLFHCRSSQKVTSIQLLRRVSGTVGARNLFLIYVRQILGESSAMSSRILSFKASILWLVDVTLIFDGTQQIIVQRCQIALPRWPNDISSAANNAILKNRTQNIECSFGCVARSAEMKQNVANIPLLQFCEQKFVQHGPLTTAIDCNDLSLLIF